MTDIKYSVSTEEPATPFGPTAEFAPIRVDQPAEDDGVNAAALLLMQKRAALLQRRSVMG